MDTPHEICEKRDVKGLYEKAREGKIKSPVYTRRLIQIGIRIKLIRIRVNAVNPVQNPDYLIHIGMWFETRLNPVQARTTRV